MSTLTLEEIANACPASDRKQCLRCRVGPSGIVYFVSLFSHKSFHEYIKKKGCTKEKFWQSKKKRWNPRHPQGGGNGWGGKVCLWKEGLSFALDYHVNAEGLHHALRFLLHQKHVPRIRLLRQDLQALKQLVGDEHSLGRGMILVQEIDEAQDR